MKWFGLTGGIATGKSTVAAYLRQKSIPVADADNIVHQLLSNVPEVIEEIVAAFGQQVLLPQGGVDRKTLGQVVFADPAKLIQLESILHPKVKQQTQSFRQRWRAEGHRFAIYDVPLLFEKQMQTQFDGIICVTSSDELQRQRLKSRNSLSDQEIEQRLQAQLPMSLKESQATWVISNQGRLKDLYDQVDRLLKVLEQIQ